MNIWLILRLDHWEGARLNDATRAQLMEEMFDEWVNTRVRQLLAGDGSPSKTGPRLEETGAGRRESWMAQLPAEAGTGKPRSRIRGSMVASRPRKRR